MLSSLRKCVIDLQLFHHLRVGLVVHEDLLQHPFSFQDSFMKGLR